MTASGGRRAKTGARPFPDTSLRKYGVSIFSEPSYGGVVRYNLQRPGSGNILNRTKSVLPGDVDEKKADYDGCVCDDDNALHRRRRGSSATARTAAGSKRSPSPQRRRQRHPAT